MADQIPWDEETLGAYLDGELDPELSRQIDEAMRSDLRIRGFIEKRKRLDNLMKVLDPIQERYSDLAARQGEIRDVLDRNAETCREVAGRTMLEVKEKMGLRSVWKV